MSQIIQYKGEKILYTAGYYWYNGLMYKTEKKAKAAIDAILKNKQNGI